MTKEQAIHKIKSLQFQVNSLCCKIKNVSVVYQSNSSTFPQNVNLGSWLLITDDGTDTGTVLEIWLFNGTTWSSIPLGSSGLPANVVAALLSANSPSNSNPFATIADLSSGSNITVVTIYSELPDPTTVATEFFWVSNSQGTSWLPGSLGGTYYPKGLYYSNGTTWEYLETPYQATQSEVNTGTNTDKFVTPSTLNNYSKWTTKEDTISIGTTSQYFRGDKTFQILDKTAVGLNNVDNTSDINKPVSTATQTALNGKQDTLISGTNIKTINNASILGAGNIVVPQAQNKFFYCNKVTQSITGVTGTHNFTNYAILIPAGTVQAGDCFQLTATFSKYNSGTCGFGVSIGNAIGNPTQGGFFVQFCGTPATDTNNRIVPLERKHIKVTSTGLIVPNIMTTSTDATANQPILLVNPVGLNWANDVYITPYVVSISATTVDARLDGLEFIIL